MLTKCFSSKRFGFTLIELLIVVAIIAILAAIAVPNFIEAQMRAKISRVKADLRTVKTGMESYYVDNNEFPHLATQIPGRQNNRGGIHMATGLSTPISYLSTVDLADPFCPIADRDEAGSIHGTFPDPNHPTWEVPYSLGYVNIQLFYRQGSGKRTFSHPLYLLMSLGPDYIRGDGNWSYGAYAKDPAKNNYFIHMQYDSTNGSKSVGDILTWQ